MRRICRILRGLASVINAVSCLVVLCVVCPRIVERDNLSFDYAGVIVAILALLVTVLIGWNIYSIVDLKSVRKYVDDEINSVRRSNDKQKEMLYRTLRKAAYRIKEVDSDALSILSFSILREKQKDLADSFAYVVDLALLAIEKNMDIERFEIVETLEKELWGTYLKEKDKSFSEKSWKRVLERLVPLKSKSKTKILDLLYEDILRNASARRH